MRRVPLAELVRNRLNTLIAERGISHENIAPHLQIGASAVSKLLSGKNDISVEHLDGFCAALQVSAGELVAEPGALIQALTPVEAALVDVCRKMSDVHRHYLLAVLDWQRGSTPKSKRPTRSIDHLSYEDAMVLSLYRALEDSDAQAGIVMQMRGYVQARLTDPDAKRRGEKS